MSRHQVANRMFRYAVCCSTALAMAVLIALSRAVSL